MQWAKSGIYTMLSSISNKTVERTERQWVSWAKYIEFEGEAVAEKQKAMKLLVDI